MKTVEAKIVVLGPQGVGKTSVSRRYVDKLFSIDVCPTIGASFFSCKIEVDDCEVHLQVWDTAGQERFRSLTPMYYRNANAAMLIYDITCYESFLQMKSWVNELGRRVDEPLVLCVLGNKCDLKDVRAVTVEEARAYANSIQGTYFETSAFDNEGISEAFQHVATSLIGLHELSPDGASSPRARPKMINGTRSASRIQLFGEDKQTASCC